jgi:hypothetical protein
MCRIGREDSEENEGEDCAESVGARGMKRMREKRSLWKGACLEMELRFKG